MYHSDPNAASWSLARCLSDRQSCLQAFQAICRDIRAANTALPARYCTAARIALSKAWNDRQNLTDSTFVRALERLYREAGRSLGYAPGTSRQQTGVSIPASRRPHYLFALARLAAFMLAATHTTDNEAARWRRLALDLHDRYLDLAATAGLLSSDRADWKRHVFIEGLYAE